MSMRRFAGLSFLLIIPVWIVFSWPLPRHFFSGIPASAHNSEHSRPLKMIPGDHLQLLYHFELARDMIAGETPFLHNIYEFNTGSDEERFAPGAYFAPFSMIYAASAALGGQAFGWNITGFLSLWLGFLGTWLLTRRYTPRELAAAGFALAATVLPYRWITLFGGSPSGPAMMWVPWLYLGLDTAVRDERIYGGVLAGAAMLFACTTDAQVFFFSTLSIPFWCVLALLKKHDFEWKNPRAYLAPVTALLPLLLFGAAAFAYVYLRQKVAISGADVHEGRSLTEVAVYSPSWFGLISPRARGMSAHIYIGIPALVILIAGSAFAPARPRETGQGGPHADSRLPLVLLTAAIAGIILLALGTKGPFNGAFLKLFRKIVPAGTMIRQPAKVFCLMPALLAVSAAIAAARMVSPLGNTKAVNSLLVLLPLVLMCDFKLNVNPDICLLENEQGAYAAVAEDAERTGKVPRAAAVPLWPGDSAWSSLYEHYALLYRVRMLNGYSPAVSRKYIRDVFGRLHGLNKGRLTDGQIAFLEDMGIKYLILHENAFPEKVSPFPVCFTLKNFLNHPRLSLLKQSGPVWAFRILNEEEDRAPVLENWRFFFPSRRWQLEYSAPAADMIAKAEDAAYGKFVSLDKPGQRISTRRRPPPTFTTPAPALRWLVRGRGHGWVEGACVAGIETNSATHVRFDSDAWIWARIPAEQFTGYAPLRLDMILKEGRADLDSAVLVAGEWLPIASGKSLLIPAPCFFHAGYTEPAGDTVVFRPQHDPARVIFYGPHLPLEKGAYEIEMVFGTPAPEGTELGRLRLKSGHIEAAGTGVVSGRPAVLKLLQENNFPIRLEFEYSRTARMAINRVVISRL
ncbi:MAG: hypothetical protein R6V03_03525 [Kiritimatiellia bacterium]